MAEILSYRIDLTRPEQRRVDVTLELNCAGELELFLPTWTPGSYLLREYSRHLGGLEVKQADGSRASWHKAGKNRFRLEAKGPIEIRYSIYAHELSVRTCDLTDDHAFLTGAAVFLWPLGSDVEAVEIDVDLPGNWQLSSSLAAQPLMAGGQTIRLRARSHDELIDSPILAGELSGLEFDCLDKAHHLVLDGLAGIPAPDSLIPDTRRIIEAAAEIFGGELPYERYEFQCMFSDSGYGGLEHLASSALLSPRTALEAGPEYQEFMGLVAHEFFHVWNVKRMRPAELWDFDYENENYTELLWVAEGFTAYYDDHICLRTGILSAREYLDKLGKGIMDLWRTPGRFRQSLSEASYDAWIRLYRPDEDTRNSTLSYYGNGALAALCLDLEIRSQTDAARSLDDAVRQLYTSSYCQGRGYTIEDVRRCLGDAAGNDLSPMIRQLTEECLDPDFDAVLQKAGLRLVREDSDTPYLGIHFKPSAMQVALVLQGCPAEEAGLMPGDEILAVEGLRVSTSNWAKVFKQTTALDQPCALLLSRRGRILERSVIPRARPFPQIRIEADPAATDAQLSVQRAWLHGAELAGRS